MTTEPERMSDEQVEERAVYWMNRGIIWRRDEAGEILKEAIPELRKAYDEIRRLRAVEEELTEQVEAFQQQDEKLYP